MSVLVVNVSGVFDLWWMWVCMCHMPCGCACGLELTLKTSSSFNLFCSQHLTLLMASIFWSPLAMAPLH